MGKRTMMGKRINRAVELLEQDQAIYYDGPHSGHVLTHAQGRIDRSHLRHVAPRCVCSGTMIAATTGDLNEAEFVSRDVE